MKKYEYDTQECAPEELFDVLNSMGIKGWDFVTLVVLQKMIVHPAPAVQSFSTIQKPPEMVTTFKLIFKREIDYCDCIDEGYTTKNDKVICRKCLKPIKE